jgi:hypothetical protein
MPHGLDARRAVPPASRTTPRSGGRRDDTPVGRWRRDWEQMKGWPEGVPITIGLLRELKFERQRTSVQKELADRLGALKLAPNPASVGLWTASMAVVPQSHMLLRFVDHHPAAMAVWLILLLALMWWIGTTLMKRLGAPSLRACLRRAGVDCCARCGHLLGDLGPTTTCPECGQPHDELPLGWGPGPIEPAAGPRR